jgi:hypothetical protein
LRMNNDFSTGFACGGVKIVDGYTGVNIGTFRFPSGRISSPNSLRRRESSDRG